MAHFEKAHFDNATRSWSLRRIYAEDDEQSWWYVLCMRLWGWRFIR